MHLETQLSLNTHFVTTFSRHRLKTEKSTNVDEQQQQPRRPDERQT